MRLLIAIAILIAIYAAITASNVERCEWQCHIKDAD